MVRILVHIGCKNPLYFCPPAHPRLTSRGVGGQACFEEKWEVLFGIPPRGGQLPEARVGCVAHRPHPQLRARKLEFQYLPNKPSIIDLPHPLCSGGIVYKEVIMTRRKERRWLAQTWKRKERAPPYCRLCGQNVVIAETSNWKKVKWVFLHNDTRIATIIATITLFNALRGIEKNRRYTYDHYTRTENKEDLALLE